MHAYIYCYERLEPYWNGLMRNEQKVWWSRYPLDCNDYLSTCGAKNRYNVPCMNFSCYRMCFKANYHDANSDTIWHHLTLNGILMQKRNINILCFLPRSEASRHWPILKPGVAGLYHLLSCPGPNYYFVVKIFCVSGPLFTFGFLSLSIFVIFQACA